MQSHFAVEDALCKWVGVDKSEGDVDQHMRCVEVQTPAVVGIDETSAGIPLQQLVEVEQVFFGKQPQGGACAGGDLGHVGDGPMADKTPRFVDEGRLVGRKGVFDHVDQHLQGGGFPVCIP